MSQSKNKDVVRLVFLILHFIALPVAIIAALMNGLFSIAAVDGVVFLMLFAVEAMFAKKTAAEAKTTPHMRRGVVAVKMP